MSILTVVETPSIKKYVFSTDKLMEIRGASALLDYLNRHELEAILKPGEKIYANGGSGQFVFEMSAAEVIEKLQQAQKHMSTLLQVEPFWYGELPSSTPGSPHPTWRPCVSLMPT